MYNNQTSYVQQPVVDQPIVELNLIQNRLSENNSVLSSIIYEIEDKLHCILNLRQPQKESNEKGLVNNIQDFSGAMHEQISFMNHHIDRLRNALDHLKRII